MSPDGTDAPSPAAGTARGPRGTTLLPNSDVDIIPAGQVRPADPAELIWVAVYVRKRWWSDLPSDETVFELGGKALTERRHLTLEEFEAAYGADPQDIDAVRTWAEQSGLRVVSARAERRTVLLTGTIHKMSKAFGTKLEMVEIGDGTPAFRSRTRAIWLPGDLASVIETVLGLSARPLPVRHTNDAAKKPPPPVSYTPQQFAAMYKFPSRFNGVELDGEGQRIAILEFGGGYRPAELEENFRKLGLRKGPTVWDVETGGAKNDPTGDPNQNLEVMLDLVIIGAIVPKAELVVYWAPNTHDGWAEALKRAVYDVELPSVISVSWVEDEENWKPWARQQIDDALKGAALRGITVCCAAGDWGTAAPGQFNPPPDTPPHVYYPASSPFALACGGTTLTKRPGGHGSFDETVWNTGLQFPNPDEPPTFWATGGGISTKYPLPEWQEEHVEGPPSVLQPIGIKQSGEGVPDVAGNAAKLWNIGNHVVGGTSAVAPLWAALIAKLNQALGGNRTAGYLNPLLYSLAPRGFNNVPTGQNWDKTSEGATPPGYAAMPDGWDACTGLGSPNGKELLEALLHPKVAPPTS